MVMLCEVGEDCCQYFPLTELQPVMEHGEFRVETARGDSLSLNVSRGLYVEIFRSRTGGYEGTRLRDLRLTAISGEVTEVKHIQLSSSSWPNYGVVDQLDDLLDLVGRVCEESEEVGGALLVHCSGGLGRSGTFTVILAIYNMMRRDLALIENYLGQQEEIVLTQLVLHLRSVGHPWMVEGEAQYLLAYQAALAIATRRLQELQETTGATKYESPPVK